jgi:diguanylate cyclase (GGDEF)-like protein
MMMKSTNPMTFLEGRSQPFWILIGFILVTGIGILDYLTGFEYASSLFYLIPISYTSWFAGKRIGIVMSLVSTIVWFVADIAGGHPYTHPFVFIWNAFIRLSFFLLAVLLLSMLHKALEHERELARTDPLTSAVNSRFFSDLLHMEIERSRRYDHPFTLAYIDLDNFKVINDRWGHTTGDRVLQATVECVKKDLRKTDIVARLGGDEFAILLPETDDEASRVVLSKIQRRLLDEMRQSHWPVTFSIGVVTFYDMPLTGDEVIKIADEIMYTVKNDSKNAINYSRYYSQPATVKEAG